MFTNIIEPLRDLAEQNRDVIGFVVINLGNAALGLAKHGLDVATPLLQQFFSEYPPGRNY
ncbi:hypothetical protein IU440_27400 [Nocardia cyriacigeorgica]|uniref:Uncharacterized protein n=1 Tax=Nocardia cyriacigeorgica (strain GUH-2) TaxID=1127134 RepID=H6R080_NOCCG|nr:hypothetical protein [Nocardia cyriacigeorgica]MBF6428408.1 hypothetical protein [Nocardia cyriacigeorgica]BDU06082.1 hypothetical protein FMUBM48_23450 [Nocardia cyriacigeorgica]CCF62943.1 conserved protein of unknown function [Nocardia cyriacigeorgica GUH-2]